MTGSKPNIEVHQTLDVIPVFPYGSCSLMCAPRQAHYDLSNHLFETFLDKDLMMYSSAIYDTTPVAIGAKDVEFVGSLEDAEFRKVKTLVAQKQHRCVV